MNWACWILLVTSGLGVLMMVVYGAVIPSWHWWRGDPPGSTLRRRERI